MALVRAITQAPDDESTLERTVLYLRRRVRPVVWTLGLGLLLAGAVNLAIGVPDSLPPVSDLEVTRAETRLERHTDLYEAPDCREDAGNLRPVSCGAAEAGRAGTGPGRAPASGRTGSSCASSASTGAAAGGGSHRAGLAVGPRGGAVAPASGTASWWAPTRWWRGASSMSTSS